MAILQDRHVYNFIRSMCGLARMPSLNGKALATTAGTRGVGIDELEALSIQPIRKIERGAQQIEEAFLVDEDLDAFVFEYLICGIDLVVEAEVVH